MIAEILLPCPEPRVARSARPDAVARAVGEQPERVARRELVGPHHDVPRVATGGRPGPPTAATGRCGACTPPRAGPEVVPRIEHAGRRLDPRRPRGCCDHGSASGEISCVDRVSSTVRWSYGSAGPVTVRGQRRRGVPASEASAISPARRTALRSCRYGVTTCTPTAGRRPAAAAALRTAGRRRR